MGLNNVAVRKYNSNIRDESLRVWNSVSIQGYLRDFWRSLIIRKASIVSLPLSPIILIKPGGFVHQTIARNQTLLTHFQPATNDYIQDPDAVTVFHGHKI